MDGLLERIEENKLDALYLFINETLRDQIEFDRFLLNLLNVLPHNWSIQRLEIGHEFLSMLNVHDHPHPNTHRHQHGRDQQHQQQRENDGPDDDDGNDDRADNNQQPEPQEQQHAEQPPAEQQVNDQQQPRRRQIHNGAPAAVADIRPSPNTAGSYRRQYQLFEKVCNLESLRTLIISDGYVPRKDNGSVNTDALLENLPAARNLVNLDLQRLRLHSKSQVKLLADAFRALEESLEEIRITGLSLGYDDGDCGGDDDYDHRDRDCIKNGRGGRRDRSNMLRIDDAIKVCVEMDNLRSLAISSQSRCNHGHQQQQQQQQQHQPQQHGQQQVQQAAADAVTTTSDDNDNHNTKLTILSQHVLVDLIKKSTTLQDLALRAMHLDDDTCQTIAKALHKNADGSFLTSLDIRQNPSITINGYKAILTSLEQNYDLWCSVMVDNQSFQGKFNSLIELNQANRGDLLRNPSRQKLIDFLERLNEQSPRGVADGTSLWYFLTIHESILRPLVAFLKWKHRRPQDPQQQDQEQQQQQVSDRGGSDDGGRSMKRSASDLLDDATNAVGTDDDYGSDDDYDSDDDDDEDEAAIDGGGATETKRLKVRS